MVKETQILPAPALILYVSIPSRGSGKGDDCEEEFKGYSNVSIPSRGSGKGDFVRENSAGGCYDPEFQSPLGEVVKETL